MSTGNSSNKSWRRRDLIKLLGATAIAGPAIFERTMARAATSKVIKIGHVSSPTGVFAPVAQADPFILDQIRTALAKGITNGGVSTRYKSSTRIANQKPTGLPQSLLAKNLGEPAFDSGGDCGNRLPFNCRADQVVG